VRQLSVLVTGTSDLVVRGLDSYLSKCESFSVITGKYESDCLIAQQILEHNIDVLIADVEMNPDTYESFAEIKQSYPELKVVLISLSNYVHPYHYTLSEIADAIISKEAEIDEISNVIIMVSKNFTISNLHSKNVLSAQETEVLELMISGLTNKEIAQHLHICERTVSYYITNLFNKLNATNRVEASMKGMMQGHIRPSTIQQWMYDGKFA